MTWSDIDQRVADILQLDGDPEQEWADVMALIHEGVSVDAILATLIKLAPAEHEEHVVILYGALAAWNMFKPEKQQRFIAYEFAEEGDEQSNPRFVKLADSLKLAFNGDTAVYLAFLNQKRA